MLMVPVAMAVGIVEGWNKNKADRLVAKNRVLRLEAERKRLDGGNTAEKLAEESRVLGSRPNAPNRRANGRTRSPRASGARWTRRATVLCPACNQWRAELGVDGSCEPCEIEDEIESAIT